MKYEFTEDASNPRVEIYQVDERGEPIGEGSIGHLTWKSYTSPPQIAMIYLNPEWRGRWIARELLRYTVENHCHDLEHDPKVFEEGPNHLGKKFANANPLPLP